MAGFAPCFAGSFTCSFASCSTSPPAACQALPATGDCPGSPSRGSRCAARGRSGGRRRKVLLLHHRGIISLKRWPKKGHCSVYIFRSRRWPLHVGLPPRLRLPSGSVGAAQRGSNRGRRQVATGGGPGEGIRQTGGKQCWNCVFHLEKKIRKIPDPEGRQPGGAPW